MPQPPNPRYLFPKVQQDRSPRLDNLKATPAAMKADAQRIMEPLLDVFTTLAGGPVKAALSAATYSGNANAAFVTPRSATAKLTKFLDGPLEHLPNPPEVEINKLLENTDLTFLHDVYSKFPEGREILKAVPRLPNIPIRLTDTLPANTRGRASQSVGGGNPLIEINAFPVSGEFNPAQVLFHETQHFIDPAQGRVAGTNLKEAGAFAGDLKAAELMKHMSADSTISKKKATEIMEMTNEEVYARQVGENRARMDAKQEPIYDIRDTWMWDEKAQTTVTGK
jgi:hypothetical protein